MTAPIPGSQIAALAAAAIAAALARRLGNARQLRAPIQDMILQSDRATIETLFDAVGEYISSDADIVSGWRRITLEACDVLPLLARPAMSEVDIRRAAQVVLEAGALCRKIDADDMAYNLFELSYGLTTTVGDIGTNAAEGLLATARTETDQIVSAAWRLATERVRDAVRRGGEWIAALDAVEFALTMPPAADVDFRRQLFDQLRRAVMAAEETPIAPLFAPLLAEAPPGTIDEVNRREFLKRFLDIDVAGMDSLPRQAIEFYARVHAQSMIDDIRIDVTGVPPIRPSISWIDLTLRHRRLTSAVPLGQSLTTSIERSGEFLLDLTHEIAHAYCLLGPVGWAHTSLQSAVQYLEMILVDRVASPLSPDVATRIAMIQLELSGRAQTLQTIWTPWLEGVAMYVELLCDPKQSVHEIIAPHAAVRALIDPPAERQTDESFEAFLERFAVESARDFEDFYSAAIERYSRLRHIAYATTGADAPVYLSGYLVARSLVARWEVTLGRRISPISAAKLLLDATRNGSGRGIADLSLPPDAFVTQSTERLVEWVASLAAIDRSTLEEFFAEGPVDEQGEQFGWSTGHPTAISADHLAAESAHMAALQEGFVEQAQRIALGIADGDGEGGSDDALGAHREAIRDVVDLNLILATLLPCGHDFARVILVDEAKRVIVFPRTYAGLAGKGADLGAQRYSVGGWIASHSELDALRGACIAERTARVAITRVLDLVGHSDAPVATANTSYVCVSVGSAWSRTTIGYVGPPVESTHPAFHARLRRRLTPLPFMEGGGANISSTQSLANRLAPAGVLEVPVICASVEDSRAMAESTGYRMCARAFGTSHAVAHDAVRSSLESRSARLELFGYLHASGGGAAPAPTDLANDGVWRMISPGSNTPLEASIKPFLR